MSTSLEHLLPAPEEVIRCAEHARIIGVDPGGTAIRADRVVVVPTPAPWPKPALGHPLLADLAIRLAAGDVPTRLLAAVPAADGPADVVVYDRAGGSAVERRFAFDGRSPERLAAIGRSLAPRPEDPVEPDPELVDRHDPARPAVLICTQGTHDVCCGSEGTRLADSLEALVGRSGGLPATVQVVRVSHTGGHRFAPTAMTLPDGRMWSGLDVEAVSAILARRGDAASLSDRCRGWWGAANGAAQIAERALFAELGWELDARARSVEPLDPTPQSFLDPTRPGGFPVVGFVVAVDDERWRVDVVPDRTVPTIACRQPGGMPAKPAREYRVVSVDLLGG